MASIPTILARMRRRNSKYMDVYQGPKLRFVALGLYKPVAVTSGVAKTMATQLQVRNVEHLQKYLLELGMRQKQRSIGSRPRSLSSTGTLGRWHGSLRKPHASSAAVGTNECPHAFACEVFYGLREDVPRVLPTADESLKRSGTALQSDDEAWQDHPRKRRRKCQ